MAKNRTKIKQFLNRELFLLRLGELPNPLSQRTFCRVAGIGENRLSELLCQRHSAGAYLAGMVLNGLRKCGRETEGILIPCRQREDGQWEPVSEKDLLAPAVATRVKEGA